MNAAFRLCIVFLCALHTTNSFLLQFPWKTRTATTPSFFSLQFQNSNETVKVPESRISQAGSTAKQAVDDDLDFERVKDAKFLERNRHWVVLVDDEESIRLAVGDYLYDRGYQVTACSDADAFMEACRGGDRVPDAIISDVRMPGPHLNGLELLGWIRAQERLSRVPVILLTAKGMTADRIAGYKAGANVYLPKPFAPEELLSILDNSIQRRQQMTNGNAGSLIDLQHEIGSIKAILKSNSDKVVKKTKVYLTLVERDVLDLLCQGYTNKEIAAQRGVNLVGVNRMIQKLYRITETETRTELVRWAMETGYVSKR